MFFCPYIKKASPPVSEPYIPVIAPYAAPPAIFLVFIVIGLIYTSNSPKMHK
tara:strand:+ start:494 stop:649 length:156 start_codon:yes stop_codon:yes gene_type:complete